MGKGSRVRAARRAGKQCIFCDDVVGSGEHILPDWLKHSKTVDHTAVNHTQSQTLIRAVPIGSDAAVLTTDFGEQCHGGPATKRKEPVVCAPCNNGWMSRLENKAKPVLLPIVDDEPQELDEDAQRTVARWADKMAMVYETTNPASAVTTQRDRLRVMNEAQPRPALRTQVWIGRTEHSPQIVGPRHRYVQMLCGTGETEKLRLDVVVVGYMCLVVTGSQSRAYDLSDVITAQLSDRLVRIWPITRSPVRWPPPATMTAEDIEAALASVRDMQVHF